MGELCRGEDRCGGNERRSAAHGHGQAKHERQRREPRGRGQGLAGGAQVVSTCTLVKSGGGCAAQPCRVKRGGGRVHVALMQAGLVALVRAGMECSYCQKESGRRCSLGGSTLALLPIGTGGKAGVWHAGRRASAAPCVQPVVREGTSAMPSILIHVSHLCLRLCSCPQIRGGRRRLALAPRRRRRCSCCRGRGAAGAAAGAGGGGAAAGLRRARPPLLALQESEGVGAVDDVDPAKRLREG